jgi:heme A synthase
VTCDSVIFGSSERSTEMDGSIVRALIMLVFAAVFWMQARGARDQPGRKRAFELLATACLVFALLLGTAAARVTIAPLSTVLLVIAAALIIAAIFSLLAAFRGGEMRGQSERVAAAKEFRERRTMNDER